MMNVDTEFAIFALLVALTCMACAVAWCWVLDLWDWWDDDGTTKF